MRDQSIPPSEHAGAGVDAHQPQWRAINWAGVIRPGEARER
jgi:hypothetical protein